MLTGKIIALAVAGLVAIAGIAGYFVTKMRADDALERAKWADDARYHQQMDADIAAGREAAKRPAYMPQSPATWGR